VQGLDEEDLERLLRLHIQFVSISFEFSLIHVHGLVSLDESSFKQIMVE
jgi:hypothetical protein